MPIADIRGAAIHYEVLGDAGPWVALSPGGRRALAGVKNIAAPLARAGYRVLVHDRRNCGASDVVIDPSTSEALIWVEDMHALLAHLGASPAFVGGASSGSRLALMLALTYPQDVRGLLLWRLTGGAFAANRLAEAYHDEFIGAAKKGGMAAVCATEHFAALIAARPANREKLMAMDPAIFIDTMTRWRAFYVKGVEQPVLGASEAELRSIRHPVILIPGNDRTHWKAASYTFAKHVPQTELHDLFPVELDLDAAGPDEWAPKDAEIVGLFDRFMRKNGG